MVTKIRFAAAALAVVFLSATAAQAADPAVKCESGKLKVSSKYSACRLKADAKAVSKGIAADYAKCESKFADKWIKTEAKAGPTVCPSEGDQASMDARITTDAAEVATLLAGGSLPAGLVPGVDPILPKTGQATCYDAAAGTVISCIGTGQDGEVQAGQARTFTDNTDGTFTDDAIGLMWEAKCDGASCGTLHDKDTTYTWEQAFTSHVATLNTTNFAGHNDWRVPNFPELQTLWDMDKNQTSPPTTFAEFDSCQADCDVTSCNCTASSFYWSSTTFAVFPKRAWFVYFNNGNANFEIKTIPFHVRAVRGGL